MIGGEHEDLIGRIGERRDAILALNSPDELAELLDEAASALLAQAREIEGLKEELATYSASEGARVSAAPPTGCDLERPPDRLITITIGIDRNGDVYNDTLTHGNSFADIYRGFHAVKAELDRQIAARRDCPYNPIVCIPGFRAAEADWSVEVAGRAFGMDDWLGLTFSEQAAYASKECITTPTDGDSR